MMLEQTIDERGSSMFDALHDIFDHDDLDDGDAIDPSAEYQSGQLDDLFSDLNAELWPCCKEY